jgi:hypothetical protein
MAWAGEVAAHTMTIHFQQGHHNRANRSVNNRF